MKKSIETACLTAGLILLVLSVSPLSAATYSAVNGHVKVTGKCAWHDTDSLFSIVGVAPYIDGAVEVRLKNEVYFSKKIYLQTHYEAILSGGDTRRKTAELLNLFGLTGVDDLFFKQQIEDDRRLMDLTGIIFDEQGHIGYHRLDRFVLNISHGNAAVALGRQTQTWGNGMIFNPLDLCNPFSPTDIQRDYKTGDDMLSALFSSPGSGNVHLLYVPRRNPEQDVDWDYATLAAKWHFAIQAAEFDIMGARHYEDFVVGLGMTGYLKNAVWRMDGTWTILHHDPDENGFFTLAANIDYSWVWWNKNIYGFLELYHNGLGRSDPLDAFLDQNIMDRMLRGELFTLGRNYAAALLQCELHPLFNVACTAITNLHDPSGILLPRAVWDMAQNIQLTFGAMLFLGARDTEYGGIAVPSTDLYLKAADNVFAWCTWYF